MSESKSPLEYVSQWLDGEGSARQLRAGARTLARSEEDRARLARYRRIGDLLRGEARDLPEADFARSVRQRIAQERSAPAPVWARWSRGWLAPRPQLLGGALAVLALLAIGALQWGALDLPRAEFAAVEAQPPAPPPVWMHEYLAAHAEYAAAPLTLPYAQMIDYAE